jgi:hypothetical protein
LPDHSHDALMPQNLAEIGNEIKCRQSGKRNLTAAPLR